MIRHGNPPYLECSSRGDKRFSAFCAKVGGRSIESIYQAAKIFPDGSTNLPWQAAKGRTPTNAVELETLYRDLWRRYIYDHPELAAVLKTATGLSDMFGQPGRNCQATVLWEIRAEIIRCGNMRPAKSPTCPACNPPENGQTAIEQTTTPNAVETSTPTPTLTPHTRVKEDNLW